MQDWIKNMIETECSLETDVKGFPRESETIKFYVVRVGTDAHPCSQEDIEEVQRALAMASVAFEETAGLAKCLVVPHTIKIDEMDVEIKTTIKD
jgi:hypothetical protein